MKLLFKYIPLLILAIGLLTSCIESRKGAMEKFNELSEQAEQLNTAVDEGLDKIEAFDSVVRSETQRIQEYDSLIDRTSSKIDSVANEKIEAWRNIVN